MICLLDHQNAKGCKDIDSIISQLHQYGISDDKIELHNVWHLEEYDKRVLFLKNYSDTIQVSGIAGQGAVAECGVYRGHFAHFINKYFDKNKLYLFDTFSGLDERDYDERDIDLEMEFSEKVKLLKDAYKFGEEGNENIVLRRLPHKENAIIRKGYVPDTFVGLEEERFVFINLDLDLYAPTKKALQWFSARMIKGGLILCRDYYYKEMPGVKQAVDEFLAETRAIAFPIGDDMSIAIIPLGCF